MPAVRVQEAQQHLRERGLAGAGCADNGDPPALRQAQIEAREGVPVLALVPSGQPLEDDRERGGGRLPSKFRFPYGRGRVQHLVDALRAPAHPLPVLHGERQPEHGLEGCQWSEHHDGHGDPAEPPGGDRLGADEGRGGDGQAADQSGESVTECGGGGGAGGDPGEDAVRLPCLGGTGGQSTGDGQLRGPGEEIGHPRRQFPAGGGQSALGTVSHGCGDERDTDTGGQQAHGERGTCLGQQPGREAHGGRGHHEGGTCGQQPAQPVVLEGVHVGDEP